jgi:hypothetical protein
MFYLWNINQLVKDLKAGIVTEYEKFQYLFCSVIFIPLQFLAPFNFNSTANTIQDIYIFYLFVFLQLAVLAWGFYYCFSKNKNNDNKNFIERFICLSVPVGFRVLLYSALALIGLFILGALGSKIFFPHLSTAFADIANSLKGAPNTAVNINALIASNPTLKAFSSMVMIANYIFKLAFAVLFFILLGKKIDEVGKAGRTDR